MKPWKRVEKKKHGKAQNIRYLSCDYPTEAIFTGGLAPDFRSFGRQRRRLPNGAGAKGPRGLVGAEKWKRWLTQIFDSESFWKSDFWYGNRKADGMKKCLGERWETATYFARTEWQRLTWSMSWPAWTWKPSWKAGGMRLEASVDVYCSQTHAEKRSKQ